MAPSRESMGLGRRWIEWLSHWVLSARFLGLRTPTLPCHAVTRVRPRSRKDHHVQEAQSDPQRRRHHRRGLRRSDAQFWLLHTVRGLTNNSLAFFCWSFFFSVPFGQCREEAQEYIAIGTINGLFVLGRCTGFIGSLLTWISPVKATNGGDTNCLFWLLGHYLDQKRLKQGLYRHPWDDISYVLPEKYSEWSEFSQSASEISTTSGPVTDHSIAFHPGGKAPLPAWRNRQ